MKKIFTLFSFLLALCHISHANIIYVSPDSTITSIQQAIDIASGGDTVLVLQGTYTENIDFGSKNLVVMAKDGSSKTTIQGNGTTSVVKITGEHGRACVLDGFMVTGGKSTDDSLGGGITCKGVAKTSYSSPTLKNNIIKSNSAKYGGGLYCYWANPRLEGNTFDSNSADENGGGIFASWSSFTLLSNKLELVDNNFTNNEAKGMGGGLYCINYCKVTATGNTFDKNRIRKDGAQALRYGGAIFASSYCQLECNGNKFTNNQVAFNPDSKIATANYGSAYALLRSVIHSNQDTLISNGQDTKIAFQTRRGGGIYAAEYCSLYISNAYFENNLAKYKDVKKDINVGKGGAIYIENSYIEIDSCNVKGNASSANFTNLGGGIFIESGSTGKILNNIFEDCRVDENGGAINMNQVTGVEIKRNTFMSCNATGTKSTGGAIHCENYCSPLFENNLFVDNSATISGGAMCYKHGCTPVIINNTMHLNSAPVGGGIYLFYQSPATIINNIIVGEVDDSLQAVDPGQAIFIQDQESESVIEYCNIWGYMDGTVGGFGDMGKGCVSKDPLFVDAGGMDYHIKRTSPCVDAGTSDYDAPLLDYENEARFDEPSMPNKGTGRYNYFDIGMDEYDPPFTEVNDGGNLPQSVSGLVLGQNFPNPFNPVTTIIYSIEKRVKVTLKVYTLTGQVVKTLVDDILEPGRYSVIWDGSNVSGSDVASGVYIYRLETNNFSITRKMILVK